MDYLSSILLLTFIYFFIQFLRLPHGRSRKLPPGPAPFPIIGNLLELGDKPHKSLAKLADIYGPIMSLQLGRITTVVVTSDDMAKGVLQTHDQFLSNRTVPDAMTALNHHECSFAFLPVSPLWRAFRKLCNNQLFGNMVLDASQDLRRSKVQQLLEEVRQSSEVGETVDIGKAAFKTAINLLSNSIFSVDLVQSADRTGEFKETVVNILKEIGRPNVADYFPILKKLDPLGIRRRATIHFRMMLDVFHHLVTQRLKLRETTGSPTNNDILDSMLSYENRQEIDGERIQRLLLVRYKYTLAENVITILIVNLLVSLFRWDNCIW